MNNFYSLPEITFPDWSLWGDRHRLDKIDYPGVYLLAHFRDHKPLNANNLPKEVIYIGETCNQTLQIRWRDFNSCAFANSNGHSGGVKYRKDFEGEGQDYLYVSAIPMKLPKKVIQSLYIRYIERKLILQYALKWGKLPKCNSK